MRENTVKQGFSLMEMMVVLLIMAIIAAATAPIVSKKMMASKSITSPWVFTGEGKNIAYNMGGLSNAVAIIGAAKVPSGTKTRLYIDCGDDTAQIALGKGDTAASILADPVGKRVGIYSANSTVNVPNNTVSLGMGQNLGSEGNIVAIGSNVTANALGSTGIGFGASASGDSSTAIGYGAYATSSQSTAVGSYSTAGKDSVAIGGGNNSNYAHAKMNAVAIGAKAVAANDSIAIGKETNITGVGSIVIGNKSKAAKKNSIVIGNNVEAKGDNQIVLGTKDDTVYIPGNIVVGKSAYLGADDNSAITALRTQSGENNTYLNLLTASSNELTDYYKSSTGMMTLETSLISYYKSSTGMVTAHAKDGSWSYYRSSTGMTTLSGKVGSTGPVTLDEDGNLGLVVGGIGAKEITPPKNGVISGSNNSGTKSDRRLKNVGENFSDGLEALSQLEFYHFTFKDDESKTPHVGVMAQDLQKVFPDAVTKGEDGYLRIRFEDMFFAMINAIKELDEKISNIIAKNDEQDKSIEAQQATMEAQQKLIEAQQKTIEKLEKRITELEKKS